MAKARKELPIGDRSAAREEARNMHRTAIKNYAEAEEAIRSAGDERSQELMDRLRSTRLILSTTSYLVMQEERLLRGDGAYGRSIDTPMENFPDGTSVIDLDSYPDPLVQSLNEEKKRDEQSALDSVAKVDQLNGVDTPEKAIELVDTAIGAYESSIAAMEKSLAISAIIGPQVAARGGNFYFDASGTRAQIAEFESQILYFKEERAKIEREKDAEKDGLGARTAGPGRAEEKSASVPDSEVDDRSATVSGGYAPKAPPRRTGRKQGATASDDPRLRALAVIAEAREAEQDSVGKAALAGFSRGAMAGVPADSLTPGQRALRSVAEGDRAAAEAEAQRSADGYGR